MPSGLLARGLQVPVAGLHVPAFWHWLGAGQVTPLARQTSVHCPPRQAPPAQLVPSGLLVRGLQVPVAGSHEPAFWHWPGAGQVTPLARQTSAHCPPRQAPPVQLVPSGLLVRGLQVPVAGLHVPMFWQARGAGHVTCLAVHKLLHTPARQVPPVHRVPSGLLGSAEHFPVAGLQPEVTAVWHSFGDGQTTFLVVQKSVDGVRIGQTDQNGSLQ